MYLKTDLISSFSILQMCRTILLLKVVYIRNQAWLHTFHTPHVLQLDQINDCTWTSPRHIGPRTFWSHLIATLETPLFAFKGDCGSKILRAGLSLGINYLYALI